MGWPTTKAFGLVSAIDHALFAQEGQQGQERQPDNGEMTALDTIEELNPFAFDLIGADGGECLVADPRQMLPDKSRIEVFAPSSVRSKHVATGRHRPLRRQSRCGAHASCRRAPGAAGARPPMSSGLCSTSSSSERTWSQPITMRPGWRSETSNRLRFSQQRGDIGRCQTAARDGLLDHTLVDLRPDNVEIPGRHWPACRAGTGWLRRV